MTHAQQSGDALRQALRDQSRRRAKARYTTHRRCASNRTGHATSLPAITYPPSPSYAAPSHVQARAAETVER